VIQLTDAIISLYPTAKFILYEEDYSRLEWYSEDIPKPTNEELETEVTRLQNIENNNKYKIDREKEYPKIGDQLDMLWHMMDNETIPGKNSTWYNTIKEVKDNNPK
jgi:hypothetical protein